MSLSAHTHCALSDEFWDAFVRCEERVLLCRELVDRTAPEPGSKVALIQHAKWCRALADAEAAFEDFRAVANRQARLDAIDLSQA